MILTPHMLVGAAIASRIHNLWIILILGIILHFLADALPHWQYEKDPDNLPSEKIPFFVFKVSLDLVLGSIIIWWLLGSSPLRFYAFFGAFVSLLPDGFTLLNILSHQKLGILNKFHSFHKKVNIFENKNSPIWGVIVEVLIVVLSIYFIPHPF